MKSYNLETEFSFGKFEGKTVKEVLDLQISYLEWCLLNLDHFYVSDEVIAEIKLLKPSFEISESTVKVRDSKLATWQEERENDRSDSDDYFGYSSAEELAFEVAFEGDADAWNSHYD